MCAVMVSSDLMDRSERSGSIVRQCVCDGIKLQMTEDKIVLSVELLGYKITVPAVPLK